VTVGDEPELLRRVLDDPDEDTHRLVYADWLDENGQAERAEFIRVQCEIAGLKDPHSGLGLQLDLLTDLQNVRPLPTKNEKKKCGCRHCTLRRREQELYATSADWLLPTLPDAVDGVVIEQHEYDIGVGFVGLLRRGFVNAITCPAADWLEHGDAVLSRHPVRRVGLTTMPTGVQEGDHFVLDGDPRREHIPLAVTDAIDPTRSLIQHVCLRYRFPGVEFLLPPPEQVWPTVDWSLLMPTAPAPEPTFDRVTSGILRDLATRFSLPETAVVITPDT
jgi:uncharacterized protein (TIGR02996 family)